MDRRHRIGRRRVILDASVAVKLVVAEPGTIEARAICFAQPALIAPDWVLIETSSAIWGKVMRSELRAADIPALMRTLPDFFQRLHSSLDLLGDGMRIAVELQHPVYDCLYLALALRVGQGMLTADKGFVASAKRAGFEQHVELLTWKGSR